jgi:hypothetical protein
MNRRNRSQTIRLLTSACPYLRAPASTSSGARRTARRLTHTHPRSSSTELNSELSDRPFPFRITCDSDSRLNPSVFIRVEAQTRVVKIPVVVLQLIHQVAPSSRLVFVTAPEEVGRLNPILLRH